MRTEEQKQMMLRAMYKLDGLEFVHVSVNPTWTHDYERALPPHSIRVSVRGGEDKEIAEVIWRNKVIGVRTCGNTKGKVTDCCGFKHKIRFERI